MKKKCKSSSRRHRAHKNRTTATKELFPANTYYAHTMPGLEKIAWREIERKLPNSTLLGFKTIGEQNGIVFFEYNNDPSLLLQLRTVEDVFLTVASLEKLSRSRKGLNSLRMMVENQINWQKALRIHRKATGYHPKSGRLTTFRVISRKLGSHHFPRQEAQYQVKKGIEASNPRWVPVDDNSILEVWLNISYDEVIVGLRLSDKTMRNRPYKLEHLPASLRPTVAASMVLLSKPRDGDIFLDPMCGAGTILIERGIWGRYKKLIGGDIRIEAVETALSNIGNKYKPIEIRRWDATKLTTIPNNAIDKVVCNLPFGKQIGSQAENKKLYGQFLTEITRVLKPGGRMILLTGDFHLLNQKLRVMDTFMVLEVIPLTLLGVKAKIFVTEKQIF